MRRWYKIFSLMIALFMSSMGEATTTDYAVVDQHGRVINIVKWDGKTKWDPGMNLISVDIEPDVRIGDIYDARTDTFIKLSKKQAAKKNLR